MALYERYLPGEHLGHGPLGDVFLAEDTETGQRVVIRALDRRIQPSPQELAALRHEAATLKALKLPTIAPYLDIFTYEGRLHLVMPHLPGQTLDAYLREHGPLDPRTFQAWAISLTHTLAAAHLEGVVHGDIRPGNIFIVPKGPPPPSERFWEDDTIPATRDEEPHPADNLPDVRLVIADFGLYHLIEGIRLSTTTARLSLSNFTSPQRWQGQKPIIDDDIWSLGVLFFRMVSGRLPFDARSDAAIMHRVLHAPTPDLRKLTQVPRGLVAIIEHCLEKDPWRRYRSLGAVLADLERGRVRWPGRRPGLMPRRQNPWLSWGIFLLFLLLILGIPAGGGAAFVARNLPTTTPIQIAAVIFWPTPTVTPAPLIVPFVPSPVMPPVDTPTPSPTWTPLVITNTPTPTFTPSNTPTVTPTASITPSRTPTPTATATETPTPTLTPSHTPTPTPQPSPTASPTPTATASPTSTPSASPTPTATFTPTATPTATPNATATQNYAAFLTRAAVIQGTQRALETWQAPTATPNVTATSEALGTLAATMAAQRVARSRFSAVALCQAHEQLLVHADFNVWPVPPNQLPGGFVIERFEGDAALHMAQTSDWAIAIPNGYTRVRFDMMAPEARTPPLTVSLANRRAGASWSGWQMTWTISDSPESTGLLLRWVQDGEPVAISSLIPLRFDTWVTVELSIQPLTTTQSIVTLAAYTEGTPQVASLMVANGALTPLNAVVVGASVDSAPWLDNLLICHNHAAAYAAPDVPSP